jgi:starvation-inducible DNA-binding protein
MKEFLTLTSLSETTTQLTAEKMMHELLKNHEKIIQQLLNLFEVAKENNDEVTLDLMIERKGEHEEIAWMLRSTVE